MWKDHLRRINITKHLIALSPADAMPVHSAPYRAGPTAPEVKKYEIVEMLVERATEPSQM